MRFTTEGIQKMSTLIERSTEEYTDALIGKMQADCFKRLGIENPFGMGYSQAKERFDKARKSMNEDLGMLSSFLLHNAGSEELPALFFS